MTGVQKISAENKREDDILKIHITNLHGQSYSSTAQKVQNQVADIAKNTLNYNELGIFCYDMNSDTTKMLYSRLDGIIAAVSFGDIVIFQFPSWNGIRFDEAFIGRLNNYRGLKKIFFVHDMPPLMFEENRYLLKRYIDLCNQADVIILPSQNMADYLCAEGLKVEKKVIHRMWDFPVVIDHKMIPRFNKIINFAGNPEHKKFAFVKNWSYDKIKLAVTVSKGEWGQGKNICYLGWFNNDAILANALRNNGGFGLVWTGDPYCEEYMKLNANCKFSTYLASGLPVIVNSGIAEKDTVIRKNLGFAVDSLDEAVDKIENMSEEQYKKMVSDVNIFSELLRQGYFTKKALTDAVFKLLYD